MNSTAAIAAAITHSSCTAIDAANSRLNFRTCEQFINYCCETPQRARARAVHQLQLQWLAHAQSHTQRVQASSSWTYVRTYALWTDHKLMITMRMLMMRACHASTIKADKKYLGPCVYGRFPLSQFEHFEIMTYL